MKFRAIRRHGFAMAVCLVSGAAHATGDIGCSGVDGSDATVDLNFGTLPVLSILNATITTGGKVWTTQAGKGETEIIVGQAAETGNMLIADFTDANVEQILISLRLFSAEEGGDFVRAGTLTIKDYGAHAVSCEGP
ncbi:MAG: hypothetical protein AB3N20_21730 [Rhizobiaceae bacterium]